MEDQEDILFLQFKNYLLSNEKIISLLTSDSISNNWIKTDFYIISSEYIKEWKKIIHFDEICRDMNINENNKIIINDIKKDMFSKSIKKYDIYLTDLQKCTFIKLDGSFLRNTMIGSYISNSSCKLNVYDDFDLISKNAVDSFFEDESIIKYGKISVLKCKTKIIINLEKKYYIIIYLDKRKKDYISPNQLDRYLKQIFIEIVYQHSEELLNEFNKNICEILKDLKTDNLSETNLCTYKNSLKYIFYKKKDPIPSITNISSIPVSAPQISKNKKKSLIANIKHINTILIVKPKNTSYVVACMYSLSHIKDFTEYFYGNNVYFKNFPCLLLLYFQEYINRLWINNKPGERFEPKRFMFCLKESFASKFTFKKEREPIEFLKVILNYLNDELNNKDKDIENDLILYQHKIKDPDFVNFYVDNFVKKNNSIVSKIFYGVFKETSLCERCGESSDYEIFNYIDLNITNYTNYQSELDNSLVYYYLDDLIEFYFNYEKRYRYSKCEKCYKSNKITKKIIKFPEVIIFRINWGRFSKDNGFQYEKTIEEEKNLILEENKLIFNDTIDLTNFDMYNNKTIYKVRSIINYSIINDNNKGEKSWKKFITFNRHLVNDSFYSYQPSGTTDKINNFDRKKFVPSILFFEKNN